MQMNRPTGALRAVTLALILGAVIAPPATAQTNADNDRMRAERSDEGFDLGWLGLIGLAGLLGLRKKDRYNTTGNVSATTR
jgi:MYXO-CTERM domain-containing protein